MENISYKLLKWYNNNRTDLPWRKERTPYTVWISEIMLQQTVRTTVIPYYKKWISKYPDINSLAGADEQEILKLWEGLGYYSRARNILRTAKILKEKYNAEVLADYHELIKLPGIGEYTASAILSIAFREPYPVLDANVRRVFRRFFAWLVYDEKQEEGLKKYLKKIIPGKDPGDFNEALMELGQTICLQKNPLCSQCVLQRGCQAYRENIQDRIPVINTKKLIKKETSVLLILHRDRILLQKNEKGLLQGLWQLPRIDLKNKRERDQKASDFIEQNISRDFSKGSELKPYIHHYTFYHDRLFPLVYQIRKPRKQLNSSYTWVKTSQLDQYPVASVYRRIFKEWSQSL